MGKPGAGKRLGCLIAPAGAVWTTVLAGALWAPVMAGSAAAQTASSCTAQLAAVCPTNEPSASQVCAALPVGSESLATDTPADLDQRFAALHRETGYAEAMTVVGRRLNLAAAARPRSYVDVGDQLVKVATVMGWHPMLAEPGRHALKCAARAYELAELPAADTRLLALRLQTLDAKLLGASKVEIEEAFAERPQSVPVEMAHWAQNIYSRLASLIEMTQPGAPPVSVSDLDRAIRLRRDALAQAERDQGKQRAEFLSYAHDNLAVSLTRRGQPADLEEAETEARIALQLKLSLFGSAHDSTATSYSTLGSVLLRSPRPELRGQGLQLIRVAVLTLTNIPRLVNALYLTSRVAEVSALLAASLETTGQPADLQEAIVFYKMSVNARQSMRAGARTLPFAERIQYTRLLAEPYERLAELLQRQHRYVEAQHVVLQLQDAEIAEVTRGSEEDTERLRDFERQFLITVAEIQQLGKALASTDEAMRSATEQRIQRLIVNARATMRVFLPKGDEAVVPEQLVADYEPLFNALTEARANEPDGDYPAAVVWMPLRNYTLALLTTIKGTEPVVLPITRDALKEHTDALARGVLNRDAPDAYKSPARALYRELLATIMAKLATYTSQPIALAVAAVGDLRRIPFAALIDERGVHVLESKTVGVTYFYASSIPALGRAPRVEWRIAAFGSAQAPAGSSLNALQHVKQELDSIVAPDGATSSALPGRQLYDPEFKRRALESALKGSGIGANANVIHVASHFVFDRSNWPASYLVTSGPDRFSVGWLDQQLSLVRFELIALSACGTEAVDDPETTVKASAAPTLGSRLLEKGARSVLGTLWSVDDDSAAIVMGEFYKNRGSTRKKTKLAALKLAQAALYARKPHPFYWAPYVLMGNWQ